MSTAKETFSDQDTKQHILEHTVRLLALGYTDSLSMRDLAKSLDLSPSAIYYHFTDKEDLLKQTFIHCTRTMYTNKLLLPSTKNVEAMMQQRLQFTFDQATPIVAVLKFFMSRRSHFNRLDNGYIPAQAYQHITEVVERANLENRACRVDPHMDAKIIIHSLNGFILEYYPDLPDLKQQQQLVHHLTQFALSAIELQPMTDPSASATALSPASE